MKAKKSNDSAQQKMNKAQQQKETEQAAGFGDKKIEGPNKPSV